MADKISATITFVDTANNKGTKAITDISPTATDSAIKNFCVGLMGLTTNTLAQVDRVEKTDITNATPKPKLNLVLHAYASSKLNFSSAPAYDAEDEAAEEEPKLFANTALPKFAYEIESGPLTIEFPITIFWSYGVVYFNTGRPFEIAETTDTITVKIYFEETDATAATTVQLVIGYSGAPTMTIL